MKLIKAEITGFGHYRQQQFDFLSGNQLFFGNNEVGKSTLYQFIQAMLFGFAKKSARKRDYTPLDGAAYGGKLWIQLPPYGEVRIERYRQKNKGKASVWMNEEERDEEFLAQLLAPLSIEVFQDVFTFQQEQLTEINRMQEQDLHAALLSLGISGSKQLMAKIQAYLKANDQIFKPRGQRLPLNQRLKEWQQLREVITHKEAQEKEVQLAYSRVAEAEGEQQASQERLQKIQKQIQLLQQQKINWELYEEWQELRDLKVTKVSEETQQQLQTFYQEYQHLSEDILKREEELARLEHGQETDKYFFYLDQEKEIQELLRKELEISRFLDEQARLEEQQQVIQHELQSIAQHWGWSVAQPPQQLDEQIYHYLDQLEEATEQRKEQELKVSWLTEQVMQLEQEVTQLEQKHPALLHQEKHTSIELVIAVIGLVVFVIGFFLPTSLKVLGIILGLLLVGGGIGWYWYKKNQQPTHIKPLWQEKLLQLDQLQEEVAGAQNQLSQLAQQSQQLKNYLQPSFGSNTDVHSWRQMLQEYQLALGEFYDKRAQAQQFQNQQAAYKQTASVYLHAFDFLLAWLPLADKNLVQRIESTRMFAEEMQELKMARLQQPSTLLAQQLRRVKENREALFEKYEAQLRTLGLSHPTEIPLWMKQWEQQLHQQARKEELTQVLSQLFSEDLTLAQWQHQMHEAQTQKLAIEQQLSQLSEQKQRSQLQIEHLQVDGVLDELYQEESRLLSEIQELVLSWSTNKVLADLLSDLATELSEQQLPQLLIQASHYFQLLTNGRYQTVLFKEGILHVVSSQGTFDIYTLSTGTKDQLIMAVRFAYLSIQTEQLSPIIIDDGWLHYDSRRKEQLAKLFAEFGKKQQVICLSSDQEMVSYYQSLHQSVVEIKQRM